MSWTNNIDQSQRGADTTFRLRWIQLESVLSLIFYKFFFKFKSTWTRWLVQIFSYRTEILTTGVVTAKVGWYWIWLKSTKWFKIYDIFFIIFYSILVTRKRFVELKFSTLVQQLLPVYLGKFTKINLTNLIVYLAIEIFLSDFFYSCKTNETFLLVKISTYRIKIFYMNEIRKNFGCCWLWHS